MIRTEQEYRIAVARIEENNRHIEAEREVMNREGYSDEEMTRALEPVISFRNALQEEVAWYEQVSAGTLPTIDAFADTGRLLIALRINRGWTQQQLADKLGVSRAQVSRDEKNEYHGISIERAQRILEAMDVNLLLTVQNRSDNSVVSICATSPAN